MRSAASCRNPARAFLRQAGQMRRARRGARPSAFARRAGEQERSVNVLKRDAVARQGAHADERIAKGIHGKTHQRQRDRGFRRARTGCPNAEPECCAPQAPRRFHSGVGWSGKARPGRAAARPCASKFADGGRNAFLFIFVAIRNCADQAAPGRRRGRRSSASASMPLDAPMSCAKAMNASMICCVER